MQDPVKKAQEKRRAEREQLQRARERVRAAKDARRADMEKERKARDAKNKAEREKDTKDEAVASIKDKPLVDPRDKAELYKLVTLALKQTPGSPKQKATIKKINVLRKKNGMKPLKEEGLSNSFLALAKMGKGAVKNTSVYGRKKRRESTDESLWANIHKKRQRIKRGSGERMRKKGEKGAPTPAQLKRAKSEEMLEYVEKVLKKDKKLKNLMIPKKGKAGTTKYSRSKAMRRTDKFSDYQMMMKNSWGEVTEAAEYQGKKVELNNPTRGDVKKYKVYVKNDKGNVVKVEFGDPNMEIKRDDPARRKSFRARHNCDNPGPKYKARYWSCKFWSAKSVTDLMKG